MQPRLDSDLGGADRARSLRRTIRSWLWFFVICLVLSGATAIPLQIELGLLTRLFPATSAVGRWLTFISVGLMDTYAKYPFVAYGTDWLAFGHFVIAVAFLGPLRDPVRNVWVVDFGMIACLLVIPFALLMGPFRGIPFYWRLIDCSFGAIGVIPLLHCRRCITELAHLAASSPPDLPTEV